MKILHLCLGLYNFWTTYEGEYINEALMEHPDVDLRMWGRDRVYYKDGLNALEAVQEIYGSGKPDVIIVHSTMEKHKNKLDRRLLSGLEELRKSCFIVWRTFDCFPKRVPFYVDQIKRYKPQLVLTWYPDHADALASQVGSIARVKFFPHAVGRRYFNKNCDRAFDLALIGRCDGKSPGDFNPLKVYVPPQRETRPEKGNNLVNDLNQCKFSWNSPVKGKYSTLRFVEAPACGTVSIVPKKFDQLRLYFPDDCQIFCESNTDVVNTIHGISSEEYKSIQQRAYKVVMNNHTMTQRIPYLLDLIDGKDVQPQDYYGIRI